jgi:hypothetical protein
MQLPVAWENTQRAGLASQRLDCGMHMTVLFSAAAAEIRTLCNQRPGGGAGSLELASLFTA